MSAVAIGWARTGIELKQFFRERDAVVFIFAFPVVMLALFAVVFGGDADLPGGISFGQFFLPGILAAGVMLTSFQSLAIAVATEREDGTLKRLRGTPAPPVSYFLGKVGLVLATSVGQVVLLLAVAALALGITLPSDPDRWTTFAWVFVLGSTAGTLLGVAFSSVPRSARSAGAVVTSVVLLLQFTSGVFFVFSELPSWIQQAASLFPLKWMAQGMRSVFLPDELAALEMAGVWEPGRTALVLAVWALAGLALCVRTFRWTRRDAG